MVALDAITDENIHGVVTRGGHFQEASRFALGLSIKFQRKRFFRNLAWINRRFSF